MAQTKKDTKTVSKTKTASKREPTPAAVLKKVGGLSDSTKTLSKEIKSMTKIFADNQKVLLSMKKMIDSLALTLEHIQKQSKQINILEEDSKKLFSGLNEFRSQSMLVNKINSQTEKLQNEIRKIEESQKSSPLNQKVSESMHSIQNNSQMIIKIAQRIDEVRDDLRKVSSKTGLESEVTSELNDIKEKINVISKNGEKIDSLSGVIDGLKRQFETISGKTNAFANVTGKIDSLQTELNTLVKRADSTAFVGEGLKSVQMDFSEFKDNVYNKTNTIEQRISSISEMVKRSEDSASEFHSKTDKVFQELQGIKHVTNKSTDESSKEIMALLKLSEYQSNLRMNAESKYGEIKDLESMANRTIEIINMFDKLSIESQQRIPVPQEIRRWAVGKILDCADKWEIRFSDVFNVLSNSLGRDLLKETIRIKQVRDIYGIRAVDQIRAELSIA